MEAYPDGLPHLSTREAKWVEIDNKACDYVLREIQQLGDRGRGSVRENPAKSTAATVSHKQLSRHGGRLCVSPKARNKHTYKKQGAVGHARCPQKASLGKAHARQPPSDMMAVSNWPLADLVNVVPQELVFAPGLPPVCKLHRR